MVSEGYESIAVVVAVMLVVVMAVAVTLALAQTCVAQSLSMSVAFWRRAGGNCLNVNRGGREAGRNEPGKMWQGAQGKCSNS